MKSAKQPVSAGLPNHAACAFSQTAPRFPSTSGDTVPSSPLFDVHAGDSSAIKGNRIVFLDWLRFFARFLVICFHNVEPFYYGNAGVYIVSKSDALWVTCINSALRAAVPLFVLASSYLLFPLKTDGKTFFRKRLAHVFIPYIIWSLLYVLAPAMTTGNTSGLGNELLSLLFNFPMGKTGHLWFVYMLIGLYLLMPLLSPWAEKVSKKEELGFLCFWGFTTALPLIRPIAAAVSGSPELWGECAWNTFGTFYYVSGFIGYLVLGHYFRKHVGEISWRKTLALCHSDLAGRIRRHCLERLEIHAA